MSNSANLPTGKSVGGVLAGSRRSFTSRYLHIRYVFLANISKRERLRKGPPLTAIQTSL